jgi:hypothetical protein
LRRCGCAPRNKHHEHGAAEERKGYVLLQGRQSSSWHKKPFHGKLSLYFLVKVRRSALIHFPAWGIFRLLETKSLKSETGNQKPETVPHAIPVPGMDGILKMLSNYGAVVNILLEAQRIFI